MNIEQLQYMCAISQHKSITKAAESLYVTQQTVSKAIHRLEKELGFQIGRASCRERVYAPV